MLKLTSSGGASLPSHLSAFLNVGLFFRSSSVALPLIKSFKKSETFSSSNDPFIMEILFLLGEIAITAGKPKPKLSYLSKSN
jgi:hypothetical protein